MVHHLNARAATTTLRIMRCGIRAVGHDYVVPRPLMHSAPRLNCCSTLPHACTEIQGHVIPIMSTVAASRHYVIGSRKSDLAMAQTMHVKALLEVRWAY